MSREGYRFWLTAAGAALAYTAAARWLMPFEALGLQTPAERVRVWLVALWCGGVIAVCFGFAGLLAVSAPLGVRDVVEAGSVTQAAEARRAARRALGGFYTNFAWWLIVTGLFLIAVYFVAWAAT